jgi:protein required for attachment to host cells
MGRSIGTISAHDETRGMHRKPITWFLVADGAKAQIYVRERVKVRIPIGRRTKPRHYEEKVAQELVPVSGMRWEAESPEEYQIGNNLLGRVFESATTARHMGEPHVDIREDLKRRFMRTIASQIQVAEQQKSFDRLVLIAPPKVLGELKKQLDESVLAHVVAELPKEMTHYTGHDLAALLEEII